MGFNTKDWLGKKSTAGLPLPPKGCGRAPLMFSPWFTRERCNGPAPVSLWKDLWLLLGTLGTRDSEKFKEPSVQSLATPTLSSHHLSRVIRGPQKIDSQDTLWPRCSEPLPVWGTILLFFSSFFQRLFLFPFSLVHSVFRKVRTRVLYTIWFCVTQPLPLLC